MARYYWIFGGVAGLFSFVLEFLLFSGRLGFDKSPGVLLAKLGALMICIVFGSVLVKKLRGSISSARTILGGAMIALICSAISIGGYTYMSQAKPEFLDAAKAYSMERWEQDNADKPEVLEKRTEKLEEVDSSYSLRSYVAFTLIGYLVSGLLVSIFTAAFIARKNFLAN